MKTAIYARVSTHDQQTLGIQLEKCREYCFSRGWEIALEVKEVGSGAKRRPKREDLLKQCRQRNIDAVVVWKLDRWGRSVPDVVGSLQELQELGVFFVSITEALDFSTAMGRAMSGLLAVFAEFERELISERVKVGLSQAQRKGKKLGRPSVVEGKKDKIRELWTECQNKSFVAKKLGISRRSVSRALS
tara:strand:+ start:1329 stop:1895 length:567 start_codon:yes stop_codon:yes gene_type:complete